MPTPGYWTAFATRYSHLRRRFFWVAIVSFLLVPVLAVMVPAVLGFSDLASLLFPLVPVFVGFGFSSWIAFLAIAWFEPHSGSLVGGSWLLARVPESLIGGIRGLYAAFLFLALAMAIPFLIYFSVQAYAA